MQFQPRAGKKVTWRARKGMYQELHSESAREPVLGVIIGWFHRWLTKTHSLKRPAGQKASSMRKFGAFLDLRHEVI